MGKEVKIKKGQKGGTGQGGGEDFPEAWTLEPKPETGFGTLPCL